MKYIRKSFSLFWLIAVMLFGTVSASAASAKPETPVLSGTAAGNRVTLNWNKVKKASGYQIFLYYKAYGKYKCVGRIKNRNITSFTLTGSEDKLYTYKIRSYLKQGNKTLYSPSSKALEIKTAPGKPVITRIRVREESGTLIKWKKIKTAEGYQIFRSESEDRGYKRINIVSGNTTFSYTDTGTVSGKTYYYRIRAYVRNQGNVVYSELSDPAEAVMRKTIMIGDSRTDMMKDVVENDNITWICEVGMGYKWLRDTALKTLQEQMKGNEDIFVWLGVNDVYNISNYISLLNEEIPKWKAQGADVYIVAVGQVTKDPYVTNEEIEDFNARMKKEVAGAKYADLYSYLKKQGYKTTDGTHYDNETTWKIYRSVLFGSGHSCVDRWGIKKAIKRFPRNRRGKTILRFPFHFVKPATKTQRTARPFWRERGGSGILLSSWVGRFRPFRFVGEWWYNC